MKVILNVDIKPLGEEGDVKNVARGYYRNYLGPRRMAVPYNDATAAAFEKKRADIEARKEQKRKDSAGTKERLEALSLEAAMPAAANGKLFGSVTAQTVVSLLAKQGFEFERKRIEIPGNAIKSVGSYHFTVKLYEAQTATVKLSVKAQDDGRADRKEEPAKAQKKAGEAKAEGALDSEPQPAPSVEAGSVPPSEDGGAQAVS